MDALLDFIGEIYKASYQPSHWDKVTSDLCKLLGAHSGAIFMDDYEGRVRGMIGGHGLPRAVRAAYRFGISRYDYTFQLQQREPPGLARQILHAPEVRADHPLYYQLILKPHDIGYLAGMNIYKDEEWHVGIGLHRSFKADAFSSRDCEILQKLYPHFKRALRIHREFHRLRTRQQTLQSALDRFMTGLVIVGPDRAVSYCNPVAKALLSHHMALVTDGQGRLRAHYPEENRRLTGLINELSVADRQDVKTHNQAIGLHHPDREHALNVMLAPLDSNSAYDSQPAGSIALYLNDPDSPFNMPAETLRSLYDMTPAEAAVATALVNGQSPSQISEHHGVSVETVRSQLKSIYQKMGVKKQQDVIRVLLSGAM